VSFAGRLTIAQVSVIGASEGIGAAIALGLAEAGSTDRRSAAATPGAMAATVDGGLRKAGGAADFETVDVRDRPRRSTPSANAVLGKHGTPTILVNSMGGTLIKADAARSRSPNGTTSTTPICAARFSPARPSPAPWRRKATARSSISARFSSFRGNRLARRLFDRQGRAQSPDLGACDRVGTARHQGQRHRADRPPARRARRSSSPSTPARGRADEADPARTDRDARGHGRPGPVPGEPALRFRHRPDAGRRRRPDDGGTMTPNDMPSRSPPKRSPTKKHRKVTP
jgi:hypothetical protein